MVTPMKTLRRLYMEMRQYDRAWCVTSAMAFLRKADAEEQQFFEQYRPKGFARARARLTEELWQRNIYHPDEDRYISHVFAAVSQVVSAVRAKEHKDWGLKRKDRRDVATDQLLFSKVFNYVNQVLGVPQPELYLRPESPGELDLANAREKNQLHAVVRRRREPAPWAAREGALPTSSQEADVHAPRPLVRWPNVVRRWRAQGGPSSRPSSSSSPARGEADVPAGRQQYLARFKALAAATSAHRAAGRRRAALPGEPDRRRKAEADLHKWSNAVDLTGTRAGLLIATTSRSRPASPRRSPSPSASSSPRRRSATSSCVDLRRVLHAARAPGADHRAGIGRGGLRPSGRLPS
jgi:hypothetical protein